MVAFQASICLEGYLDYSAVVHQTINPSDRALVPSIAGFPSQCSGFSCPASRFLYSVLVDSFVYLGGATYSSRRRIQLMDLPVCFYIGYWDISGLHGSLLS